ncbi:MAG: hypothetical protein NC321_12490 [Clostridium sp.]|nr:hypothetical protein [Clostridium sp.]
MQDNFAILSAEEDAEFWDDAPAYVKAYAKFLLYEDIDPDSLYTIRGYYLFDMNFDNIPELGVLHDSWGSAGGYFTLYYYDGNGISKILDERGEPEQISNYTQILVDDEQKKAYLLKEMYLLSGNENGTYGYVREIKSDGNIPCVYDILKLDVDQEAANKLIDAELADDAGDFVQHENEDEYLQDAVLEDCLLTQRYSGKEWVPVSSKEYLELKRQLIPEENSFVDVRSADLAYLGENFDEDGFPMDVKMEKEEIMELFKRYEQAME